MPNFLIKNIERLHGINGASYGNKAVLRHSIFGECPGRRIHVMVSIGDGINSIEESITCNDVSAGDYRELFKRGHEYAEKIINEQGAENLSGAGE